MILRRVAPVARFGATGVASQQEVANLADRSQNSGVPSRWVEYKIEPQSCWHASPATQSGEESEPRKTLNTRKKVEASRATQVPGFFSSKVLRAMQRNKPLVVQDGWVFFFVLFRGK